MDKLRLLTISMSNDTLNEIIKLRNNKWIQFDCPIMKQSKLLMNSKKGSQIDKINIDKCNKLLYILLIKNYLLFLFIFV